MMLAICKFGFVIVKFNFSNLLKGAIEQNVYSVSMREVADVSIVVSAPYRCY
jgi:hypothetical protein